jgi:tetratricopeptide (TPR) repeat protein
MSDGSEAARWEQLKDLFAEAIELDKPDRADLIARTTAADPALARELTELLAAHERTDGFMASATLPPEVWQGADEGALHPSDRVLPESFGRYRIVSLLGAGGMGEVFLAHEAALDRQVALKVLPPGLATRPAYREAFLGEARAAASLSHPNITTIHEIGAVDGRDYIAFEYVHGKVLRELIPKHGLPLADLLAMAQPLADALAYAHERGVVHRDVKTGNVMVTDRGLPKLLDFGLAASLRPAKPSDSGSGPAPRVVGTPAAMSPEQVRGESIDERTDVFSFGSLLYEMATGRPAFDGRDLKETLEAVTQRDPVPLAELRPDLPKTLVSIVEQALRKNPAVRTQRMAEVAAALQRLAVETEHAQARRLSRVALWGLSALALVAAVLAAFLVWTRPESTHQVIAVMGFDDPNDPADTNHIGGMLERLVTSNLSAGGLELVTDQHLFDVARKAGQAERRALERSTAMQIAEDAGADTMIVGRFQSAAGSLVANAEIVDLATGKTLATLQARGTGQAELFTMADSLGHQVRAALKEPAMTEDVRQALAQQLTTSVDAFRAYVRGLEGLLRNDPREAATHLREATALDPGFALAQFRLSMALVWVGELPEARQAIERALAFRGKLPAELRDSLDAIEPYSLRDDTRTALPLMLQRLQGDPYNHDLLYMVGEIYTHSATRSDSAKAAEMYERLLSLDPGLSLVYDHLLTAYLRRGRREAVEAHLVGWSAIAPASLEPLRGTVALWEGNFDGAAKLLPDPLAAEFLADAPSTPSIDAIVARDVDELAAGLSGVGGTYLCLGLDLLADILVAYGRFDDAAELYRQAAELPGERSRDGFFTSLRAGPRQRLAFVHASCGELDDARREADAPLEWQPDSYRCLYISALMALRAGDPAASRSILSTLDDLVGNAWGPAAVLYRDALAAELALADGRATEASAGFARLVDSGLLMEDWYAHEDSIGPLVRDGLARAKLAEGDTEGALAAWEGLTNSGFERLRQPVPWVLSLFHRGRVAMQLGREDEGRALLEKFLVHWGKADHDVAEVAEARALLAR